MYVRRGWCASTAKDEQHAAALEGGVEADRVVAREKLREADEQRTSLPRARDISTSTTTLAAPLDDIYKKGAKTRGGGGKLNARADAATGYNAHETCHGTRPRQLRFDAARRRLLDRPHRSRARLKTRR